MDYLREIAPFLALALVALAAVAALIAVVNVVGKNLARHGEWLRVIDLKLANLHKDKQAAYVRSIQVGTLRPPPLSDAKTVEITDEMLMRLTQDMSDGKQTRKLGKEGDDG